ncbi:protein OXIDATIVE STRESS 3 LIKE 2-like [Primulina tabacum]|uniref:protein OXIDATIVE STRESS 3 LIKE 2-like n=1 Tax=Primulina tabacum TaxID=48773 RepID=UPI003F5A7ECE
MEEGKARQILQDSWFRYENHLKNKDQWLKVEEEEEYSSHENSVVSNGSSVSLSSCDTTDDAASSSSNLSGSLYDLSELMVQLPIKRGLSKFYQGRSESFTSLSRVTSVEDLAKKTTPFRKKMKVSKSCENGLNSYKSYILPKPLISKTKKDSNKRGGGVVCGRTSLAPRHKKMEC